MKHLIIFSLFLIAAGNTYSQNVEIAGKLLNSKTSIKPLTIAYEEDFLVGRKDTIQVSESGDFKITIQIAYPQPIVIRNDSVYIKAYIFPNGKISINADIASKKTLNETLVFGGNLSDLDQSLFSVQKHQKLTDAYWSTGEKIPAQQIADKITYYYSLKQSLINNVIDKKKISDKEREILKIDSISDEYQKAGAILMLVDNKDLTNDEAEKFVSKNLNPSILNQPDLNKIHISAVSSFWNYSYLAYLNNRDYAKDKDFFKNHGFYSRMLDRIDILYKEPLRTYAKASVLSDIIYYPVESWSHSIDSLARLSNSFLTRADIPRKTGEQLFKYTSTLQSRAYRSKEGKPAPAIFTTDINGKPVSLADFKDKLVVIDVWASWCGPCIAQLPNMNKIMTQLKEKNIVFLLVSIDLEIQKWQMALKAHPSDALQLYTSNGFNGDFAKNYSIYSIPRYILIKNSVILNMSAPAPSDPEFMNELIKYIN